jgi:hypothetical protein
MKVVDPERLERLIGSMRDAVRLLNETKELPGPDSLKICIDRAVQNTTLLLPSRLRETSQAT